MAGRRRAPSLSAFRQRLRTSPCCFPTAPFCSAFLQSASPDNPLKIFSVKHLRAAPSRQPCQSAFRSVVAERLCRASLQWPLWDERLCAAPRPGVFWWCAFFFLQSGFVQHPKKRLLQTLQKAALSRSGKAQRSRLRKMNQKGARCSVLCARKRFKN